MLFFIFAGLICPSKALFSAEHQSLGEDSKEYTESELQKILDENLDTIIELLDDNKKDGIQSEKVLTEDIIKEVVNQVEKKAAELDK